MIDEKQAKEQEVEQQDGENKAPSAEENKQSATESINEELSKLQLELTDVKDKHIRLYSEFENFRRRTSKEKLELVNTATEQLMSALLPVVDDIERARGSIENAADVQSLKEGIELVFNKFYKVLENKGLKPLESKGKDFNPDIHEAITQIPAPSADLKGKVVDEIEKGYYLNDKLIRVAKVVTGA